MNPLGLPCTGYLLLSLFWLSTATAECHIRYQYSVTDEHRPLVEQPLSEGESLHVAQTRLSFIENIGARPVRLFMTGVPVSVIMLAPGERLPALGTYESPTVALVNVTCPVRWDLDLQSPTATIQTADDLAWQPPGTFFIQASSAPSSNAVSAPLSPIASPAKAPASGLSSKAWAVPIP